MNHETQKINALSRLMDVGQELASSTDLDELLAKIMRASLEISTSRRASILLVDENTGDLYFRHQLGEHGQILEKIRVPLTDQSVAGWCLMHREPVLIHDVSQDPRHYKRVDEATSDVTRSMLAVPIMWGERAFGVIEVLDKTEGQYEKSDVEYLTILAAQAAVALNNVYLVEQLQNFFVHTVELLIAALETVDPSAKGHTERVARMATGLARELGMGGKDREQVLYGAYFHDIGRLLNRTSRSDLRDPIVGAQLLERIKMLEKVAPIVRSHRERFDGSGYPDGLKGSQIPLGARILGLAVDYDEQFTKNSQVLPPKVFHEWYFEHAKNRHDPHLLDVFRKVVFPQDNNVRTS